VIEFVRFSVIYRPWIKISDWKIHTRLESQFLWSDPKRCQDLENADKAIHTSSTNAWERTERMDWWAWLLEMEEGYPNSKEGKNNRIKWIFGVY